MKKLRLSQKLYLNISLQILFVAIIIFVMFFQNVKLKNISSHMVVAEEKSETLILSTILINKFLHDEISILDIKERIDSASHLLDDTTKEKYATNLREVARLKMENKQLESELITGIEKSITISNEYIIQMSRRLAGTETRHTVSTLQRQILEGALINTDNNHLLKEMYYRMLKDFSVKDALIAKIMEFNTQAEKDLKRLKGTALYQTTLDAYNANQISLDLVRKIVSNHEDIQKYSGELLHLNDALYASTNTQNRNVVEAGFSELKYSITGFLVIILITTLVIVFINITISKLINFVFKGLNNDLNRLANGDLTFEVPKRVLNRSDELGEIAHSVQNLITNLKRILM